MSRPPIKAMAAIKNYCEKTQCRRCVFGVEYKAIPHQYVGCRLMEIIPCDWDVEDKKANDEDSN